jgi:hypothetical protein
MHSTLIKHIEQTFGLLYSNETSTNNLCFASENAILKDEFKISFTDEDIKHFLKVNTNNELPSSVEEFWLAVKKGKMV